MKLRIICLLTVLTCHFASAQGTLFFDQQSSDETRVLEGGVGSGLRPFGQSFTPSTNGIDFARFWIFTSGSASFVVNLRSDSITGPILGATSSTGVTGSFTGALTFYFPSTVSLTPGTLYYLEPQSVLGGGLFNQSTYQYSGGIHYANGQAYPFNDMWFREGISVPEPGTTALLVTGSSLVLLMRRKAKS